MTETVSVTEKMRLAGILEKSAELLTEKDRTIEDLQAKLMALEGTLETVKQASLQDTSEDLASSGLTPSEAQMMVNTLPAELLRKVANTMRNPQEGWEMGKAASQAGQDVDPMEAFAFGLN